MRRFYNRSLADVPGSGGQTAEHSTFWYELFFFSKGVPPLGHRNTGGTGEILTDIVRLCQILEARTLGIDMDTRT